MIIGHSSSSCASARSPRQFLRTRRIRRSSYTLYRTVHYCLVAATPTP
jgi:hypothetical protein